MKSLARHMTLNRSAIVLVALAVVLILTATVGTTLAYFTTYATAKGSVEISFALSEETKIVEDLDGSTKVVHIENAEGSRPVFVRAKAFSGSTYPLAYEGSGWIQGDDGYYYYGTSSSNLTILEPGASTSDLDVDITFPQGAVDGDSFNVVVVYETTPVLYKNVVEGGVSKNVPYADWSVILDSGTSSQGGGQ